MPAHRFQLGPDTPLAPGPLTIAGDEAHHAARVKRLDIGQAIEVLDGRGGVASGRVAGITKSGRGGWEVALRIDSVRRSDPLRPRLEVWSAVPKGTRAEDLIDSLSQVGAALWRPLLAERSVVDPREGKLNRLERVASEAGKQCGREWTLEIGPPATFDQALATASPAGHHLILAEATGGAYQPADRPVMVLLIGPEGGWTDAERDRAKAARAAATSFGPHTMRIETAAPAAAAIILNAERTPRCP